MKSQQIPENFSLVSGGLLYDLMNRIPGLGNRKKSRVIRALMLSLITWLPLVSLSMIAGTFKGSAIEITFIEDFPLHVRFLLVIPFLILMEKGIDQGFLEYVRTTGKMISAEQQEKFARLIQRIDGASNAYLPEILILVLIYSLILLRWNDLAIFSATRDFLSQPDSNRLSLSGWYCLLISYPVFQLLVFRWIWRWFLWAWTLMSFARFQFRVEALHYDTAAGLEYLNLMPFRFSMIFPALSVILSSNAGFDILFENAQPSAYLIDILVYTFMVILLLYGPLLLFMPRLMQAKSRAIHQFGNLISRHNIDFMDKWVDGPQPEGEASLGSMDNSSLADINGSYDPVKNMKMVPWNFRMILSSTLLILLPFTPLVFTYYSFNELITKLISAIVAG